jgi:aminopeptidase N
LFVESKYNKQVGQQVIYDMRNGLANDRPVTGPYNVNQMGSGDMYNKGAILLNMIRTIVDDDDKWLSMLNGVSAAFYHQTLTSSQIIKYLSERANRDLAPVFDQYLNYSSIPVLEFNSKDDKLNCRWIASAKGFNMPVRIKIKGGAYKLIYPDARFKTIEIENATIENIIVDTDNYYIGVLKYARLRSLTYRDGNYINYINPNLFFMIDEGYFFSIKS